MNRNYPQQYPQIFKYGPPIETQKITGNRNILFQSNETEEAKKSLTKQLPTSIETIVRRSLTQNITEIVENTVINLGDTITTVFGDTITNTTTNIINNIAGDTINNIFQNIDLEPVTTTWAFDTNFDFYTFAKVSINSSENLNFNLFIDGSTYSKNLTIKDNIFINDTKNKIHIKDNHLFFNNCRLDNCNDQSGFDYDIISTSWALDTNSDLYSFSKVAINNSDNNDYNLFVKGNTYSDNLTINDSLFFSNSENKVHIKDNHLFFNNCQLDKCGSDTLSFYFDIIYSTVNSNAFIESLKNDIILLDDSINFTFLNITLEDKQVIKVNITIRDDICISNFQKLKIKDTIKKIYGLITNEQLFVNHNSENKLAMLNIYFLNEYYYFDGISRQNAFKLVKRSDENNSNPLISNQQVYLMNMNNEYLQDNYTFSTSNSKLLLEVHGFSQDFNVSNPNSIINRKDGFKLEVLPPVIININEGIIGSTIGQYDNASIVVGDGYMNNLSNFVSDSNWTNPGINPNLITDEIYLSENINIYIEDPNLYNEVFLVDERWLTVTETNNVTTYSYTFNDNFDDSKKFFKGVNFCDLEISDFVFNKNYKLETIEEHTDFMFLNKHLPALCSQEDYYNYININSEDQRREDILHELEKAHVYIYQLNEKLKDQDYKINNLQKLLI